ncbi:hypothetical protein [Undibacterium sp.]|uniref:hypothetical protein n=1 Tax=Undibacterium sp. TaxID=1914977 RepID=UPI00272FFD3A|nr:hypothetical protein [Undibacterium sp.]MDP1976273.1 hypothetical protein [Undibacterium sp.]
MPSLNADFTDDELEMLEMVRVQWGLSDLEETAQFLAKRHLRQGMQSLTGRGRAMSLVSFEDLERTTE